jgi:E3 ubiquitin-protein ligase TRIP12
MPTLLNVLSSNDQKVVEQGCLCVSRVVESFKYKPEKLEELIEPNMLRAVLRLLLPGTTNLIGPHIHTQFLRVLAITARSSPRLSMELLKMNVVDTLYQILTGVSPPSDSNKSPIKVDSVHIMQALIHRPREQVYETLNVICEILPGLNQEDLIISDGHLCAALESDVFSVTRSPKVKASAKKRMGLLKDLQPEIKRFATILFPTLTDTYSSTVNLGVRQKVLIAQVKMLQDLDASIVEEALRPVPYASFLASILSQRDHLALVALALQCSRLLLDRLENIYQYQFHREGVIMEISKLAELPLSTSALSNAAPKPEGEPDTIRPPDTAVTGMSDQEEDQPVDDDLDDDDEMDEDNESHDEDDYPDEYAADHREDLSESDSTTSSHENLPIGTLNSALQDLVAKGAKDFLRAYEGSKGSRLQDDALEILQNLKNLVGEIESCYKKTPTTLGRTLFQKLAAYFNGDALDNITSSELLSSGIIDALLNVIGTSPGKYKQTFTNVGFRC